MKKLIFFIGVFSISGLFIAFQFKKEVVTPEIKIEWITMQEAYTRMQKEPRKLIVDVYTDWCGWCKVMDKNTFTNNRVAEFVDKNYYAVKFNAEQREDVILGNQTYKFMAQNGGGVHQLAAQLLNGQLSYPTVVFLDEKWGMIQPVAGYMDAPTFHQVITFFGKDYYKKEPFEQFKTNTYPKLEQK